MARRKSVTEGVALGYLIISLFFLVRNLIFIFMGGGLLAWWYQSLLVRGHISTDPSFILIFVGMTAIWYLTGKVNEVVGGKLIYIACLVGIVGEVVVRL